MKKNIIENINKDNEKNLIDLSQVRLVVIFGIFSILFITLFIRSIDLILLNDKSFNSFSSNNSNIDKKNRSDIFDRSNVLLATNVKSASIYANPKEIIDKIEASSKLASVLNHQNSFDIQKKLTSGKPFVWIKRQVSPKEHFQVNKLGIPGIKFKQEVKRVFPQQSLFAHVVGSVGIDNQGLSGLEKKLNQRLLKSNKSVLLTVDTRVQHALRRELNLSMKKFDAIGAAGIIMDVDNGEIIGLVSLPDFNPNIKIKPSDDEAFSRATLGSYEMGSTFKPFTVAAALQNKIITMKDGYDATKPLKVSRFIIRDDHPKERWLSVPEIFKYSSNIGMAQMAKDLGVDKQKELLEKLGILDRSKVELSEVGKPLIPKNWREINSITISYGHGIAVSLLQVAKAYAILVNGGKKITPTLLLNDNNFIPDENFYNERVISEDTSKKIRGLLRLTVKSGTAKKADRLGYEIGGKTGTAEKPSRGGYQKDSIITSFVGVFPMDMPRYVIAIMLDEPKGIKETHFYRSAGWTAAPTVGNIIERVGPLLDVMPNKTKNYWKNFEATYISVKSNE
ncbi:MAG: Peptidoglycan synthase FtsI [Alphaproteobacteria bacterium MarineAlpha2_Bin1]|nr:MAG: Peptidoglycan synthase FtsI [Alphaproteobacteria bacterium MarineAlpha2_Bin1]